MDLKQCMPAWPAGWLWTPRASSGPEGCHGASGESNLQDGIAEWFQKVPSTWPRKSSHGLWLISGSLIPGHGPGLRLTAEKPWNCSSPTWYGIARPDWVQQGVDEQVRETRVRLTHPSHRSQCARTACGVARSRSRAPYSRMCAPRRGRPTIGCHTQEHTVLVKPYLDCITLFIGLVWQTRRVFQACVSEVIAIRFHSHLHVSTKTISLL